MSVMKIIEDTVICTQTGGGVLQLRAKIINQMCVKNNINFMPLEDISHFSNFLSTKRYLKYKLLNWNFSRQNKLYDVFGEYSYFIHNSILDTIKKRHSITDKAEKQYYLIYVNKAIDMFNTLSKELKFKKCHIFIEDWHYLENCVLLAANAMTWNNSNNFFGCFGNFYLKLPNLHLIRRNQGPYSAGLNKMIEKLLTSNNFVNDTVNFMGSRFSVKSEMTSNNYLQQEEALRLSEGKEGFSGPLLCINVLSDSYYHINNRLFNSERDWLRISIDILRQAGHPFGIKLHPQIHDYKEFDDVLKILKDFDVHKKVVYNLGISHLINPDILPITNKGTVFQERTARCLESIVAVPRIIDVDESLFFRTMNDYVNELSALKSTLKVSKKNALFCQADFFLIEQHLSIFKGIEVDGNLRVGSRDFNANRSWADRHFDKLVNENRMENLIENFKVLVFGSDSFLFETEILKNYGLEYSKGEKNEKY